MIVFWFGDEPLALKEIFNALALMRGSALRAAAEKAWGKGEKDKAMQWAIRPNGALNDKAPLAVAIASDEGLKRALDVIGRIEHGIHS